MIYSLSSRPPLPLPIASLKSLMSTASFPFFAAINALHWSASAPAKPGVCSASFTCRVWWISYYSRKSLKWLPSYLQIWWSIEICPSTRLGAIKRYPTHPAGQVANIIIPQIGTKSIHLFLPSNWFRVVSLHHCSSSYSPPSRPSTASISSIKIIQGPFPLPV